MAVTPLILVGAGGFARETAEAVRALNVVRPTFDLLGFVDDAPALAGQVVDGLPVLGPVATVGERADARVVVCTGSPGDYTTRRRLVERLDLAAERYATVVHPAAVVPRSATLGHGTVVLAGTVLTTSVQVGAHVAVMPLVVLTHDDVVGDFATFGAGAGLAGGVTVGEGAYVGAGALVREHRTIGAWSLLGMGAVLTSDMPAGEVWAGVPASRLRRADIPADFISRRPVTGTTT
ncbi:MAG TPA: acetyltransferase [Acidimicrobiales bacterium]|nr:acetyltransferase [Acidimicrobiales bacterium]